MKGFFLRYKNPLIFLAGFLFDAVTIKRIDALADLLIQIGYLLGLTVLLIYQYRHHHQLWEPGKWLAKVWHFNVEALHFLYGGLLSAYTILYFKSTSGFRGLFFLFLLVVLLLANEMPQLRRFGYRLRLGLYAFCVTSFLVYFIPILIGRMGHWIFICSLIISAILVWFVAGALVTKEENPKQSRVRLYLPALALFLIILVFHQLRLIPPVPLSILYQGIFHEVEKTNDHYTLRYPKPPFYAFWRDDSRPFIKRPGDELYYFARVFAPARFQHQVMIQFEIFDEREKTYKPSDQLPLHVKGGRHEGFRGFVVKSNIKLGRWRVKSLTEDGRTIGILSFKVKEDKSNKKRKWLEIKT